MKPLHCALLYLTFQSRQTWPEDEYQGSAWRGALGHALERLSPDLFQQFFVRSRDSLPPEAAEIPGDSVPAPFVITPQSTARIAEHRYEHQVELVLLGDEACARAADVIAALAQAGSNVNGIQCQLIDVQVWDKALGMRTPDDSPLPTISLADAPGAPERVLVQFRSPLRIQQHGDRINPQTFTGAHFLRQVLRRYRHLALALGCEPSEPAGITFLLHTLHFSEQRMAWSDWIRRSNRQQRMIPMGGIVGEAILEGRALQLCWPWIWLGQFLHIGKGAAMGLGFYTLEPLPEYADVSDELLAEF